LICVKVAGQPPVTSDYPIISGTSAQLNTIKEKVDQNAAMHHKYREELPQKFVKKDDSKEWRTGRDEIWEALNNHSHDEKGRVIR
jgi:hypothetical protein